MSAEYEAALEVAGEIQSVRDRLSWMNEQIECIAERTVSPYQSYAAAILSGVVSRMTPEELIAVTSSDRDCRLIAEATWKLAGAMMNAQPHCHWKQCSPEDE